MSKVRFVGQRHSYQPTGARPPHPQPFSPAQPGEKGASARFAGTHARGERAVISGTLRSGQQLGRALSSALVWFVLAWLVLVCWSANAVAQSTAADLVWLSPSKRTDADSSWYPKPVTTISGKVVSLDNQQLAILITGDEALTRIAGERVIWIRPGSMSEKESEALKLFADGDYSAALRPLIDSLGERPPVWRQQWISMLAADAARRSSRGAIALELVSQLDARPLAPYVLAWLPITWKREQQPAASVQAAREKLADKSPAVRVVAASWLLSSPLRNQAAEVLKQISIDTSRPLLARLAELLLCRVATPPEVVDKATAWEDKLDQLPIVLQTGPAIMLAEKFRDAGLDRESKRMQACLQLTPAIPYPLE